MLQGDDFTVRTKIVRLNLGTRIPYAYLVDGHVDYKHYCYIRRKCECYAPATLTGAEHRTSYVPAGRAEGICTMREGQECTR